MLYLCFASFCSYHFYCIVVIITEPKKVLQYFSLADHIRSIFNAYTTLMLRSVLFSYILIYLCVQSKTGDIQDSPSWKDSPILNRKWNLGIALNADGLSVFKSTAYSLWPIFIIFLNLPPGKRFLVNNVFCNCLFPGPNGPKNMDSLFAPLIKELQTLWKGKTYLLIFCSIFTYFYAFSL